MALLRLRMSEDNPDPLLLAEINRELGFFEKSLELLNKVDNAKLKNIVGQIQEKALQQNPFMFRLT
jgi:hypothetical protein